MASFTPKTSGYVPISDAPSSIPSTASAPPPPNASTFTSPTGGGPLPGAGSSSSSAMPYSYNSSAFINPALASNMAAAEAGGDRVNKYETKLPIRLDIEAAGAYAFGLFSGILLLILETKNDYVRYHAWQSTLVFLTLGGSMFFISFISSFLSWILFLAHFAAVGWLGYNAYINADTLERYEVPYLGRIASNWVDNE
ncbi:hypothetical protein HDU96_009553 [Phlyctochytrium bullatum]|nr:hypothetical protein HDU96_009553 [Phlyctochytrium bullatum]